jgi:hypothetical protein
MIVARSRPLPAASQSIGLKGRALRDRFALALPTRRFSGSPSGESSPNAPQGLGANTSRPSVCLNRPRVCDRVIPHQQGISNKSLRPRNQAFTLLKSRIARTSPARHKSRISLKGFKYRLYFDRGEGRFACFDRRRRRFHFT